jgi:hypothetical protein
MSEASDQTVRNIYAAAIGFTDSRGFPINEKKRKDYEAAMRSIGMEPYDAATTAAMKTSLASR